MLGGNRETPTHCAAPAARTPLPVALRRAVSAGREAFRANDKAQAQRRLCTGASLYPKPHKYKNCQYNSAPKALSPAAVVGPPSHLIHSSTAMGM